MSRRRLVLGLLVAGLVLAAVDQAVASRIESEAAKEVIASGEGQDADLEMRSFPLIPSVIGFGEVRSATLAVDEMPSMPLPIRRVRLVMEGLGLDRLELLGGNVEIDSVDEVRIIAELTEEDLAEAFDFPIDIEPAEIVVELSGERFRTDEVKVEDRLLIFEGTFGRLSVPIPGEDYLPCEPTAEVLDDRLALFCLTDRVPSALGFDGDAVSSPGATATPVDSVAPSSTTTSPTTTSVTTTEPTG